MTVNRLREAGGAGGTRHGKRCEEVSIKAKGTLEGMSQGNDMIRLTLLVEMHYKPGR